METNSYKINDLQQRDISSTQEEDFIRSKIELAQNLGLEAQLKILSGDLLYCQNRFYTESMSEDEIKIWKRFLPTTYYSDPPNIYERTITNYKFDRIPHPVLSKWKDCKNQGYFSRYEIWTTERPNEDPMLVGYVGNRCYMVARWAESDANLVSFSDVKSIIKDRWLKENCSTSSFVADTVLISVFVSAIVLMIFSFWVPLSLSSVLLSVGIGTLLSGIISAEAMKRNYNSSSLIQAIKRLDAKESEDLSTLLLG